MDSQSKAEVLHGVIRKFGAGIKIEAAEWQRFTDAQNDGMRSGVAIGEHAPDFTLTDQTGKSWSLRDLMGANGLLLVFSRSAHW